MKELVQQRFAEFSNLLLQKRNVDGYWDGRLSSSALGTAVAVTALHFYDKNGNASEIASGLGWLNQNINADGGFGDSPKSFSNVSTTLLCYAAARVTSGSYSNDRLLQQMSEYLQSQKIDVGSGQLVQSVLDFYQTDRTFSVPILTMCALCGVPGHEAFDHIPQLPFELSLLPRPFYSALNLSVVSYAIPALIAVGIAVFKHKQQKNPLMRLVREASINRSLCLLRKIQPHSGGFLEAIPLTAFVCLCLTGSGYRKLDVVREGINFLKRARRNDGSWPIDIDLSTWVTTLAVKALKDHTDLYPQDDRKRITSHLISIQNRRVHPFNGTRPGGWGWTRHSGSVPDGDDTPGVILSLLVLNPDRPETVGKVIIDGCKWLGQLQNKDGGLPTFSRGWGKLPFDQSCSDLTGHALLAWAKTDDVYAGSFSSRVHARFRKMFVKALVYLRKNQSEQGFWFPLWFGSQLTPDHKNPVYGTARVVAYLNETLKTRLGQAYAHVIELMVADGCRFLASVQNNDGSWGGAKNIAGSIEETSLAITALCKHGYKDECEIALRWLDQKIKSEGLAASPIGLYFASLWYDEEMYPLTAYLECISALSVELQG